MLFRARNEKELVKYALDDVGRFAETVKGHEVEPWVEAFAEHGVGLSSFSCPNAEGLADISHYRAKVRNSSGAAWMDNTTLVTARSLLSSEMISAMTPLTIWDLATFVRAAIFYDKVYHHQHKDVDDEDINQKLGSDFLLAIPLPESGERKNEILPDPWIGAHRFMCEIWDSAYHWLKRLHQSVEENTLDGQQIREISRAWEAVLQAPGLSAYDLVNIQETNARWSSPSRALLKQMVDITSLAQTNIYLEKYGSIRDDLGANLDRIISNTRRDTLTDLNLRAYFNQRIADFFQLPYASGIARVPFRKHLYDRSHRILQELILANIIDDRYREIGFSAKLKMPVFLAMALRGCEIPEDLWESIAFLREKARHFRENRGNIDLELARGNLVEARKIAKALHASLDDVLSLACDAVMGVIPAVKEQAASGDISVVGMSVAALAAAGKKVLDSTLMDRLYWRLRRPELLWINDIAAESQRLTDALPDFSRIWNIPANRCEVFAQRFSQIGRLFN